jgi:antitoxin (DNA-binding transcriptional repressor) of toxin-antitoxin stability system
MTTMEAVHAAANIDKVLRMVEKNGETILIVENGRPKCQLGPVPKLVHKMSSLYRRRDRKMRRLSITRS